MITIFVDTDQQEFWLAQGLEPNSPCQIVRDIDQWFGIKYRTKLALVELLEEADIAKKQLEAICQTADQVLLFIPELIDQNWLNRFDLPNVTIYVAGKLNTLKSLMLKWIKLNFL